MTKFEKQTINLAERIRKLNERNDRCINQELIDISMKLYDDIAQYNAAYKQNATVEKINMQWNTVLHTKCILPAK